MLKKIVALSILMVVLFSNCSPLVFAVESNNEDGKNESRAINDNNERVKFNMKWSGEDSNSVADIDSNTTVSTSFNLVLSGVETGFNNLKIAVFSDSNPRTTIDIKTPNKDSVYVESSQSTGSVLSFKEKVDSGISINGNVNLNFDRSTDFQKYTKNVKFVLTGSYIEPTTGALEDIYIERTLTANVTPKEYIDAFSSNINIETIDISKTTRMPDGGINGEYVTNDITVTSRLEITGHNVGYGEYTVDVSRSFQEGLNPSDINSEINLIIDLSKVPSYIKSMVQRNSDGTTVIKFTIGENKEPYTEEELVDISSIFDIKMKYIIIDDTGKLHNREKCSINTKYTGNVTGYTVIKNINGIHFEKETDEFSRTSSISETISSYYGDYWAETDISAFNIDKTDWKEYAKQDSVDLKYYTDALYWDRRDEEDKENLKIYSYNSETESAYIRYKDNNSVSQKKELVNNEMTVKTIEITDFPDRVETISFYKKGETTPFFIATYNNLIYTVPEGEEISDYYVIFDKMYGTYYNNYPKWTTTYKLNISKLKESMSEEDIDNITEITRYQRGYFGGDDVTKTGSASIHITTPSKVVKYSYFELSLGENFETNIGAYRTKEERSIILSMNSEKKYSWIENTNPKFYIYLPNIFDYEDFKINIIGNNSGSLAISNAACTDPEEEAYYIDKETGCLVVNCAGTYDATRDENTKIVITFTRRLNTTILNNYGKVSAYMITDNGNYVNKVLNTNNLSKNGRIPKEITGSSSNFSITQTSDVKVETGVYTSSGNLIFPKANNDNEGNNIGTYQNPVKLLPSSEVKYRTKISSNKQRIENIVAISRLPMANNTSITGTQYELNSTLNLINLRDIKVMLKKGAYETEVDKSKYTIFYSTDASATFDSEFIQYTEGDTNLSNAKTIKIIYNDVLLNDNHLFIDYVMEMPSLDGVSGGLTAIRYMNSGETQTIELEPAPVYVKKDSPYGAIRIIKKFEGYEIGTAPEGISLSGIQFKIVNIKTGETVVKEGQTTSDGIMETNSEGQCLLYAIEPGTYQIKEVSEIEGFNKIGYTTFTIENGEYIEKVVENKRKIRRINNSKSMGTVRNSTTRRGRI